MAKEEKSRSPYAPKVIFEFTYDHPYWDIKFKYIDLKKRAAVFEDGSMIKFPPGVEIKPNHINQKGLFGYHITWSRPTDNRKMYDFFHDGNECKKFFMQKMTSIQSFQGVPKTRAEDLPPDEDTIWLVKTQ